MDERHSSDLRAHCGCVVTECRSASSSSSRSSPHQLRPLQRLIRPHAVTNLNPTPQRPPFVAFRTTKTSGRSPDAKEGSEQDDTVSVSHRDSLYHSAGQPQRGNHSCLTPKTVTMPKRHRRRHSGRPSNWLTFLVLLMAFAWPSVLAQTPGDGSHLNLHHLNARELSKRVLPGHAKHMAEALTKRQSTSSSQIDADHRTELSISTPKTCAPLNITWDPTKGTPPFTLMVLAELWFQLAVVTIPASYADTSLRRWLYQIDLPSFKDGPTTRSPTILAAIVDSTGKMANTSSFIQVDNSDESCAKDSSVLEFESWSEGAPVQCAPWKLGWNITGTGFVGPMLPFILPERQPPILLTPPKNLTSFNEGTGGMTWNVTVPGGTSILFSITDSGTGLTGGVGGKNLVAVDQYVGTNCNFVDKIGLPTATLVAPKMTITPDYTTSVTTTSNGEVLTVPSVVHGYHSGNSLSTGGIAGIALGVAAAAGLVLALVFFSLYKRNQQKRETLWEMPGGTSNYPKGMPVDRRLATGYRGVGGMADRDAAGESIGLTLNTSARGSMRTLSSNGYDVQNSPFSSPPTPSHMQMPYSDISPRSGAESMYDGVPAHRHPLSSSADSTSLLTAAGVGGQLHRSPSSGDRSVANRHLANAYRTALSTTNPSDSEGFEDLETVPLSDRYHSASSSYVTAGQTDANKLAAERSRAGNTIRSDRTGATGATRGRGGGTLASHRSNNVVVHSDAGLLLDDSLSDDGADGIVELPPDYDSVPVRAQRQQRGHQEPTSGGGQQAGQQHLGAGGQSDATTAGDIHGHQDISNAYRRSEQSEPDLDDAAFWRN